MPRTTAPDARRASAWALAALLALAAALGSLALSAELALARGRERLLAGDGLGAAQALASVRWPEARRRAAAGLTLASALAGADAGTVAVTATLEDLAFFEPEAVLGRALERRDRAAALRLTRLMHAAGHPLAALYAAALAFDGGSFDEARRDAAASPVPLAARGIGARLERALALRSGDPRPLVLDRSGEAVARQDEDGTLRPLAHAAPFVGEIVARASGLGSRPDGMPALRLTADLGLSRLAKEALGERRGSIVLVDPATGAVLAAVTDAVTAETEPAAAFEQRREPASIAKLITTAAAYRASHDADALIGQMKCTGVERYGGQPLWCPWPAGRLAGLDHALAVSCNVAFANLALRVGRERLVEEYRRWGFDAKPGSLLDAAGRIETVPELPRQLADLAIGLELTDITPLHAALLAAIVANGGRLAQPYVVEGGCGALGLADEPQARAEPTDVVDAAVAARLERAMRAVVQYGTAVGVEPPGLEVAMKTGTASTPRIGYHVNYVGLAPAGAPALAFCVRITGRRSPHLVHEDAREVTLRLLSALRDRLLSARTARPPARAPALAPSR